MVSNADKEQLIRIANRAGAHRLVLMGDRGNQGAVDAGLLIWISCSREELLRRR